MGVQWSKQNKLENCSKSTVKMSMAKPVLLNFMNLLTRFFTRLQCIFFFDKIQKKSPKNSPPPKTKEKCSRYSDYSTYFFQKHLYLQIHLFTSFIELDKLFLGRIERIWKIMG